MNDIEEVKSRINIVDIIGEKVELKKVGSNYFGLCPFHNEKTPSFSVNERLQIFKCFGCGEAGDVFKFLMKYNNISFYQALSELADRVGYKLKGSYIKKEDRQYIELKNKILEINAVAADFFHNELIANKKNEGYVYIKKRGISEDLVSIFKLGYASESYQKLINFFKQRSFLKEDLVQAGIIVEKKQKSIGKFRNRLIFSIFDQKGNIVGFSGRYIGTDKGQYTPPKYLNSPETIVFNKSKLIFGLYQAQEAIKKMKFVILCEGQMNVLSSYRVGVKNIVASLGTSFTQGHLDILRGYTDTIYLAFDKDNAGKKATIKALDMIFSFRSEMKVKIISWDKELGKDPDEVIMKDAQKWFDAVNNPYDPIEYLIEEFYNKNPNPNIEQKDSILRILVPIIKKHQNQVIRDEYFKKVSSLLDVNLDSMIASYGLDRNKLPIKKQDVIQETVNLSIYDHIFGLILQNWKTSKNLILAIDRDFITDQYIEIFDCMSAFIEAEDIIEISKNLDKESLELFQKILLQKIRIDADTTIEDHILKNIPLLARAKYKEISDKLKKDPENRELLLQMKKLANELSRKSI